MHTYKILSFIYIPIIYILRIHNFVCICVERIKDVCMYEITYLCLFVSLNYASMSSCIYMYTICLYIYIFLCM